MKNWALLIAGLYLALFVILTVPAGLLAFAPTLGIRDAAHVYLARPYWIWLAIVMICQISLLAVPVRVASLRPVSRGPVWRTILAGGLMAGGLAFGAFLSIYEFIYRDKDRHAASNWYVWTAIGLGLITWTIWAMIFARMSREREPADFVSRHCRWLFRGSVLELLVAVPTHIVARCRDYCCAGVLTFIGLTMGFSVMLIAFGPALYFLFADRWKRLHPAPRKDARMAYRA